MKLVNTLAAAILMSCAALVGAAEADPPTVIGRLNHISGPVSFAPAQADEGWVAASLNRPLTTGDRLWTNAGGRAEMHVGSLAIRMDALTSLDILNLDDRGLQLRLAQGSANVRVRQATANEPVEIATPGGAVVLERPGSYRMNVDPRGAVTSVAVRGGGQAEVFGQNGSFLVSDGQQATIAGPRPDLAASSAPDDFDRWSAARDRREDGVAATRYVPAAMTGYEDLDEYGTWRTVPQYGTVWQPTSVPAGWAPYRYGHWVWIDPWGWTWVDDAPWGFAPSHYGRWIWLGDRWAWAPGRVIARPVYAPALVAFIGGANFSVGVGSAPAVGWVPLGWHEPYRPWYRSSHAHVREVNIASVTNVTNITNITNVRHVNRGAPSAVTVVSREAFAGARPVQRAALNVSSRTAAAAPVAVIPSVAAPSAASLAQARPGARPPAEIRTREAVAVSTPRRPDRTALREDGDNRSRAVAGADREHPRVRVIDRRERVNLVQEEPRVAERQVQLSPPPESATARERAAEKGEARTRQGAERRVPAPPAEATGRPTVDRSGRMQAGPQPDNRAAQAQDAQRSGGEPQQERQRQADREQAQRQADARRQEEQRAEQQAQRRAQQQAEQRAQQQAPREAQPRAQDQARQQHEPQRPEQQAQRAQQQADQRAQQQAQREAQLRTQEQVRQREHAQRAEQQTQQRAQQQAEQRAAQQAQREAQLRGQEQARQREHAQRADQQAQQRAQQQAEQRAAQQVQRQTQQHVQEQARQQQQAQRAEQQAQPQQRERRDQSQEKGGRERPRGEKAEKG